MVHAAWNTTGGLRFYFLPAALRQNQLLETVTQPAKDHYVVTFRLGENPIRWGWEIRRKSRPLGIKISRDGCQSDQAAQFAGKRALAELLLDLAQEEKRN